MTDKHYPKATV